MGVVTKSHPRGFIIERLLYIEQIYTFFIPSLKITSGEISAKEVAGESTGKVVTGQINSNEHHREEVIESVSTLKQLQSLQKSEEIPALHPQSRGSAAGCPDAARW